ncbi:MAG TPA: hypothetical protein ENO17_04040 [Candidatus Atribacteria bacterium]|nr:hypothetical protein [Candidatus Atribacteria bacterium]
MQYLKSNTKFSILAFLIIVLCITVSISTLAKSEVYPACACMHADRFSLYDNPKILSTTSPKPEVQTININPASQDELIKALRVSEPLAQKIVTLRDSISGGFKEPQDLLQLPEITKLEWKEWEEEGIIINIK